MIPTSIVTVYRFPVRVWERSNDGTLSALRYVFSDESSAKQWLLKNGEDGTHYAILPAEVTP